MFKKIIAAAALAAIAASSYAGTPGSSYAGADLGSTDADYFHSSRTSYGVFVGHHITNSIAIEGGYRRLFSYTGGNFDTKADQIALSAIATLPLNNGFSVYARVGANRVDEKITTDGDRYEHADTRALVGVGASYDFGNRLSGRVEVQRPSSEMTNLSAGLSYAF